MLDIRVRVRGVYIWGEELENKTKKKKQKYANSHSIE